MTAWSLSEDGQNASEGFGELMKNLAAAYPSFRANERQMRVYAQALQDLTQEQIKFAMARAVTESRFFPSVSELRSYVGPSIEERAVLAWGALREATESVGSYASLDCEDPCVAIALQQAAGSWPGFCALEEGPQLHTVRQTFIAAYRDACRRVGPITRPIRLNGTCETLTTKTAEVQGWVGTLTADGRVFSARESTRALPEAQVRAQLVAGDDD